MNIGRPYLALLCTTLLWGVSFVGTKIALTAFTPFALIFIRFFIASLFFLFFFLKVGFPRLSKGQHLRLAFLSFFEPVLYYLFETIGLQRTSASEASLIIALIPVAVVLLSRLFLGERISLIAKIGIALSTVGITALILGGDGGLGERGGSSLVGNLLILGAVLSTACYTLLSRSLGREVSSLTITGFQFFYATLFFFPLFLLFPLSTGAGYSPAALTALLFLTFGATLGAFLCYNYALSKVKAATASVFINGIPVVTALTGWIFLGERLSDLQILGALVVIGGVALTNYPWTSPANAVFL